MRIDNSMAIMNYNKALNEGHLAKEDKALKEQTDNFESILLKFMLENAIKNDNPLYPKEPGSDIYHSMYIDQLSQELSGSFGYSELLFNFLKEQEREGKATSSKFASKNPYGK